jgi:hypothetical protein
MKRQGKKERQQRLGPMQHRLRHDVRKFFGRLPVAAPSGAAALYLPVFPNDKKGGDDVSEVEFPDCCIFFAFFCQQTVSSH